MKITNEGEEIPIKDVGGRVVGAGRVRVGAGRVRVRGDRADLEGVIYATKDEPALIDTDALQAQALAAAGRLLLAPKAEVSTSVAQRACGDCRLCCRLMAVQELKKPRGQWCQHACSGGCAVYGSRPAQCRSFECLWKLAGRSESHVAWSQILTQNDRPDKLRVVFVPFLGGVRHPRSGEMIRAVALHAVALHEGRSGITEPAMAVVRRFVERGFAVLRSDEHRCLGFWFPDLNTEGHRAVMWAQLPRDHPDAKLFDSHAATAEEVAAVRALEARAREEIATREART